MERFEVISRNKIICKECGFDKCAVQTLDSYGVEVVICDECENAEEYIS
jgi:hypothetical protein